MYFKYRDNYKRIFEDGIEFNFDSETRFRCEGNVLEKIDGVGALPKGFFSVLPENGTSPVVDSVSVVAGGNGAGKTSIVERIAGSFSLIVLISLFNPSNI